MRRRPTMEKSEFFSIYKQMFTENELERYTSEKVMEKFFLLAQIMRETNEKMNITAITEEREIIARHYIDSLFAAELIKCTLIKFKLRFFLIELVELFLLDRNYLRCFKAAC